MIETSQLRALLALLPNADEIASGMAAAVVDARCEPTTVLALMPRPWAEEGLRTAILSENGLSQYIARDLKSKECPIILLTVAQHQPPADVLNTLFSSDFNVKAVIQDEDGRLFSEGRLVAWDHRGFVDRSGSTHLCLRTQRERWYRRVNLPFEIDLSMTGHDESKWILGLDARSDYSAQMPVPVWYRLLGPQAGRLRVDIAAGPDFDRWEVTYRSDPANLRRVEAPRTVAHGQGLPSHLAVIFDRTCPDRSAWVQAYSLAVKGGGSANAGDDTGLWERDQPGTSPLRQSSDEFNREIRTALGDALSGALEGHQVGVEGWWFADTAGEGVSALDGVALPVENFGAIPTAVQSDLRDLFCTCSYSPGLDLWDPVEEVLRSALDRLSENPTRRVGVLIVGNSPPNVPADPTSPLRTLLRALGFPTSFRRFNALWHAELRRAESLDVPVVYLFLTHSLPESETRNIRKDYLRSADLNQKVMRSLGACLPLVSAEADSNGVARGVQDALRVLSTPKQSESCIEVRS